MKCGYEYSHDKESWFFLPYPKEVIAPYRRRYIEAEGKIVTGDIEKWKMRKIPKYEYEIVGGYK